MIKMDKTKSVTTGQKRADEKAVPATLSNAPSPFQEGRTMRYQSALCIIAGLLPLAVITALSLFADGFVLFSNYISELGVGGYAFLFNTSLIVAALLVVPFVFYVYGRYNYLIILFLAAATALVGVGFFPAGSGLHQPFAALFFILAFGTMLVAGTRMKRRAKLISAALGLLGFAGLAFFSPFIEALLVYAIGLWVVVVGLQSWLYEKG